MIVYVPVNRLLRILAVPGDERTKPVVRAIFDGDFTAKLQLKPEANPHLVAAELMEQIADQPSQKNVFLHPNDTGPIADIALSWNKD